MATIDSGMETGRTLIYRHSLLVRLSHWFNVLSMTVLLFSGLQIFNAHPALYWGQYGADNDPSFISMEAVERTVNRAMVLTHIGSLTFDDRFPWSLECRWRADGAGLSRWLTVRATRTWQPAGAGISSLPGCSSSTASSISLMGCLRRHFRRDLAASRRMS